MGTEASLTLFERLGFHQGLVVVGLMIIYRGMRHITARKRHAHAAEREQLSEELTRCREQLTQLEERLARRSRGRLARFFSKN